MDEARTNAEQSETGPNLRVSFVSRDGIEQEWIDRLLAQAAEDAAPVIYFVAWKDGPIKIGWTVNVQHRLHQLQASCPYDLQVLAIRKGSKEMERAYHRRFARYWIRGEWFERHPLLLNEIGKLNRTVRGLPMLFPPRPKRR